MSFNLSSLPTKALQEELKRRDSAPSGGESLPKSAKKGTMPSGGGSEQKSEKKDQKLSGGGSEQKSEKKGTKPSGGAPVGKSEKKDQHTSAPVICSFIGTETGCRFGSNCRYYHPIPCTWFRNGTGTCKKGDKCPYTHVVIFCKNGVNCTHGIKCLFVHKK